MLLCVRDKLLQCRMDGGFVIVLDNNANHVDRCGFCKIDKFLCFLDLLFTS